MIVDRQTMAVAGEADRMTLQVLDTVERLVGEGGMPREAALRRQRAVLSRTLEMLDARIARTSPASRGAA